MTEYLRWDGTVLPQGPHPWPPNGCYWSREPGGRWRPVGRQRLPCIFNPQDPPDGGMSCSGKCFGCMETRTHGLMAGNGI